MGLLIPIAIVAVAVVAVIVIFKLMWRVAEPNEAMVISGFRKATESGADTNLGFKVITGKGVLVIPGFQQVRKLSLDLHQADLVVECVTDQAVPVVVKGIVIYKVGDDEASIANAARRFLGQEDQMDHRVHNVFAGHLRSIIGSMTVESLIRDRQALTQATREASATEMQKLGLVIDSLQIQEIDDTGGYIANLARPNSVAVERDARIATANANLAAATREAEVQASIAEATRDSNLKQAGFQAETQAALATAAQAGPQADAEARRKVVEAETQVATLEAARQEAILNGSVRKQADANAYSTKTLAEAQRDANIAAAQARAKEAELVGAAEATAIKAKGVAEGDALKARADGLNANQEAVISQQLVGLMPQIVTAAASAFNGVDNLTVLDGADGIGRMIAGIITQGGGLLSVARAALSTAEGEQEKINALQERVNQQ